MVNGQCVLDILGLVGRISPFGGVNGGFDQRGNPSKAKLAYRLVTDRYQGQARVQLMIEAHDESPAT